MKTRSVLLSVIFPFFLFTLFFVSGCEKRPQYEIYENHDITACGVKDPLRNIEWIKNHRAEHPNPHYMVVSLYEDSETKANFIVIVNGTQFIPERSPSAIFMEAIYTCDGIFIFSHGTEGPYPEGWDEFFEKVKFVGTIWSCERVYNK